MPPISSLDRRKISHELKKCGFGGLDDSNLFAQIATLYPDHHSFRGLLMATAPDQRRIAYESLKPHLSFEPHSLEAYERQTKLRAEQEQWDVFDGTAFPKPFKVPEITLNAKAEKAIQRETAKGWLTLECRRCTCEEKVPGETRVDASLNARKAGWTLVPETICAKCSAKRKVQ